MERILKTAGLLTALAINTAPAHAVTLDPWTISGPGTNSVTQNGADGGIFSYNATSDMGSPVTFTAQTTVTEGGTWNYLWNYTGFHAYYMVTAFLRAESPSTQVLVNAGPRNCCTSPSAGFNFSGESSIDLAAGDILRFTFGGDNQDSNRTITGTLTLSDVAPVPLAPAGVLLISALGGFAAFGKRKSRAEKA